MRALRLIPLLLLLSGLLPMAGGAALAGWTAWDLSRLAPAEARVQALVRQPASRAGQVLYTPVLGFTTAEGRAVRVEPAFATTHPPRVGEVVPIRYDPAAPGRIRTLGFLETWLVPVILIASGVPFVLIGWFLGRLFRRLSERGFTA